MSTWRGSTCAVGYCGNPASPIIDPLPLCHNHGMAVATNLSASIIAKHELTRQTINDNRNEQTESRAGNREGGTVYYARIGGYIKVGYSTRLRNRLRSLRIDELLATEPGDPALERVRHRQFDNERLHPRRENFEPSDRLLEHVAQCREQHGLPRWAQLPDTAVVIRREEKP